MKTSSSSLSLSPSQPATENKDGRTGSPHRQSAVSKTPKVLSLYIYIFLKKNYSVLHQCQRRGWCNSVRVLVIAYSSHKQTQKKKREKLASSTPNVLLVNKRIGNWMKKKEKKEKRNKKDVERNPDSLRRQNTFHWNKNSKVLVPTLSAAAATSVTSAFTRRKHGLHFFLKTKINVNLSSPFLSFNILFLFYFIF